jgi:hypothetical protein
MKSSLAALLGVGILTVSGPAWSQTVAGSMDVHWDEGATDCKASPQAPIQVHAYNQQTFILRENLCVTFEATGLESATSCVTGRRSDHLSYAPALAGGFRSRLGELE